MDYLRGLQEIKDDYDAEVKLDVVVAEYNRDSALHLLAEKFSSIYLGWSSLTHEEKKGIVCITLRKFTREFEAL